MAVNISSVVIRGRSVAVNFLCSILLSGLFEAEGMLNTSSSTKRWCNGVTIYNQNRYA